MLIQARLVAQIHARDPVGERPGEGEVVGDEDRVYPVTGLEGGGTAAAESAARGLASGSGGSPGWPPGYSRCPPPSSYRNISTYDHRLLIVLARIIFYVPSSGPLSYGVPHSRRRFMARVRSISGSFSAQMSLVGTTVTLTGVYVVDGRETRSVSDDVGSEGGSKRGAVEAASEKRHT